jgi:hypothetical protein
MPSPAESPGVGGAAAAVKIVPRASAPGSPGSTSSNGGGQDRLGHTPAPAAKSWQSWRRKAGRVGRRRQAREPIEATTGAATQSQPRRQRLRGGRGNYSEWWRRCTFGRRGLGEQDRIGRRCCRSLSQKRRGPPLASWSSPPSARPGENEICPEDSRGWRLDAAETWDFALSYVTVTTNSRQCLVSGFMTDRTSKRVSGICLLTHSGA